jgi:CRISPR-associated protein Cas2
MSFNRINAYHVMWLFVFFDLPVLTKPQRKQATRFRKALEKDGFSMMQFSVYVRHCPSKENMEVHIKRVRLALPAAGQISILAVTDKQYSEIRNYLGAVEKARPEIPQQLELF